MSRSSSSTSSTVLDIENDVLNIEDLEDEVEGIEDLVLDVDYIEDEVVDLEDVILDVEDLVLDLVLEVEYRGPRPRHRGRRFDCFYIIYVI